MATTQTQEVHTHTILVLDDNSNNPFLVSDPVGPALLDIELDEVKAQYKIQSEVRDETSGLRVFWSRSAGHVDWYDLTLEDSSSGFTRKTRIMGSAAPQSGFSSLVPGTRYTVSVVASAGNKSAPPVHTFATTGETCTPTDHLWPLLHRSYTDPRGSADFCSKSV